jgi:hypothetical protein
MATTINASASSGLITTADTSTILQLQTGGTTAVTVDASQQVGIGVTPSAWSGSVVLQMTGPSLWGYSGLTHLSTNTYYDGTNYKYIATNFVTDAYQLNGAHVWRSAASGTAGTNVTFSATTTLNANGVLALQGAVTNANGVGITFPTTAISHSSSNANTLDDYEEGTWTPSVGGTATYFSQTGKYTKIGNMVSIFCLMRINAIGTGSTTTISGLPFTAGQRGGGGMTYWAGLSQAVDFLYPNADGTGITFLGATAASANPTDAIAIFQGGAYVIFSLTYFV